MRFLLTNDDGIDAPGLAALALAVAEHGPVLVVAPREPMSGCSHQVTTHRGLELSGHGPDRHAIDGTPVDCTRVGLWHVAPEADWVLSGVNAGGNLGADVYHSGTVAAVREAALLGKRAIAISQFFRRELPVDWETTAQWTRAIIAELLALPLAPGRFWNVNLPHLVAGTAMPEVVHCALDPHPLPVAFSWNDGKLHYSAAYRDRRREPGCDVDVCFNGRIAVTQLGA